MSHKFKDYIKQRHTSKTGSNGGSTHNSPLSSSKWDDLDSVVQTYTTTNTLPPLLTPDIPSVYTTTTTTTTTNNNNNNGDLSIPLLSPTLPKIYDNEINNTKKPLSHLSLDSTKEYPRPLIKKYGNHTIRIIHNQDGKKLNVTLRFKRRGEQLHGLGIHQRSTDTHIQNSKNGTSPEKKRKLLKDVQLSPERTERIRPSSSSSTSPISSKTEDTKPITLKELIRAKEQYLQMAIEKKHKGDSLLGDDIKLGLVHFIDCILLYLVGFSYEDESRKISKKFFNDAPWLSLISFIDSVVALTEDPKFRDLTGLCYQIKAVVYEHIIKIVTEFIKMDQLKRSRVSKPEDILKIDDRLTKHVDNLLKYREVSRKALIQSEKYLSVFQLQTNYPDLVSRYQTQMKRHYQNKSSLIDPVSDALQLPITSVVGIRPMAAYGLLLIKQWSVDQNVQYDDWAFK